MIIRGLAGRRFIDQYLVYQREVAADVGMYLASLRYAAIAADADGNVVAAHHVEDVVELVDAVAGVDPCVGADGNGLRTVYVHITTY